MRSQSLMLSKAASAVAAWRTTGKLERLAIVLCSAFVGLWLALGAMSAAQEPSVDKESAISAYWVTQSIRGAQVQTAFEGHPRPPGYTLVLTTLAFLTPSTLSDLKCWADNPETCRSGQLPYAILAQFLIAALILLLTYLLARRLSWSTAIALIAMMLALFATRTGELAGVVRAAIWFQFFLLLHFWLLVEAVHRRGFVWALAAGGAAGLSALFEPLAILIVPASALMLRLALLRDADHGGRFTPTLMAVSLLGASLATAGGLLFFVTAHTYDATAILRHLGFGLSQHVAFNGLDLSTWLLSLVAPIPWLGDLLLNLVPESEARKLSVGSVPGSLVYTGATTIFSDALARSGGEVSGAVALIVRERILEQPVAYALSLPSVLARGLFAGAGIIALIGLIHVRRMLRYSDVQGQLARHLLVVVPVVVLLLVNTFLTSNEFWLNPMLPFVYAYAIAYVTSGW